MDSNQVAAALGTDAKTLRRFLRSNASSVEPVGSGGRYSFNPDDIGTMRDEFGRWLGGVVKPTPKAKPESTPRVGRSRSQHERDMAVWETEDDVRLPDIRIPAVLDAVRAAERARVARLMELVRVAGV